MTVGREDQLVAAEMQLIHAPTGHVRLDLQGNKPPVARRERGGLHFQRDDGGGELDDGQAGGDGQHRRLSRDGGQGAQRTDPSK